MDSVNIVPNIRNRIYIVLPISKSGLRFRYKDNPDRPVDEYTAVVYKEGRGDGKKTIQKCNEYNEYEEGTYFIELNTIPVMRQRVDMDGGTENIISILEPGTVEFINIEDVSKLSLYTPYTPLGSSFRRFCGVNIENAVKTKVIYLSPGRYKAHYYKNNSRNETVISFEVKGNETTKVSLQ